MARRLVEAGARFVTVAFGFWDYHGSKLKIAREDIDRLCCHPGGVKVIDAIESALDLPQGELNLEREVLHDHGNMSAPTVLFVLDRLMRRGLPEQTMLTAFGPGFTCAAMLLERA